jgi:hypothetical protein
MMQKQLLEQAVLMGIVAPKADVTAQDEAGIAPAIDMQSYRQRKQGAAG